MPLVNVHEAKTHFSQLLMRVVSGEEIVIARAGKPIARLVPIAAGDAVRVPGTYKAAVEISDDFDGALPESVLREFEGGDGR